MYFHTPEFVLLMLVTLALFYSLPGIRIYIIGIANAIFYAIAGSGYLLLFISVSSVTFLSSLHLQGRHRRFWLWLAIGLNALNLAFFKYSLFALANLERLTGLNFVTTESFLSTIILPVGISFYTFQLIAYLVDVYQKKLEATRTILHFWVFVSFFGQLVAGPIMRGNDFLPQIKRINEIRFQLSNIRIGTAYFCLGLAKKIILADMLVQYVDELFIRGTALNGIETWAAAYLFAFQIYFDFSAYSEMAVGIGYLFGMKLDINFRTPYLSASGTEFWRRWHITLSTFIKDYLYIPLGGSRYGTVRQQINLFAAMMVSGLWHGAAWTFLIWGMYHGVLLIAHKLFDHIKKKWSLERMDNNRYYHMMSVVVFFHLTCIGWVLFRADGIATALGMIRNMLLIHPSQLAAITGTTALMLILAIGLYILHIVEYTVRKHANQLGRYWNSLVPSPLRGLAYSGFVLILVLFLQSQETGFIYFQF